MWEILAFVVATGILPVLINKSTESGRLDWIKPYLRHTWTAVFVFFSLYFLRKPDVVEVVMKMHTRLPGLGGYAVAAVCGALLLSGYWWFTGKVFSTKQTQSNTSAPFFVEIVTWSGKIPYDPNGVGFWIVKKDQSGTRMSQADIAVFLQIVNLKPFVSQLSSYSIDIKTHGKWHRTTKMIADYVSIFFVPPGGNFNHAYPAKLDTFFDHVVMGRSFQAHEPMRGWVLLQYGDGTESLSGGEKPEFRVSLSDAAGVSFRSDVLKAKGRQTNEDAQSAIVFHEGNRTADISHVRIERWSDR